MAELKCSDLMSGNADDIGVILFWLDGYVSHKTGVTQVDFDQVKANGQKLGEYCGANPDAKVLDWVEASTGN